MKDRDEMTCGRTEVFCARFVRKDVVLGEEEKFGFGNSSIELNPISSAREPDTLDSDAMSNQPLPNDLDASLAWGKVRRDLGRRPVFAIVGRGWIRD